MTPHVSHAIDEESNIEGCSEAEIEVDPEGNPQGLGPQIARQVYWESNSQQRKQWNIQSANKYTHYSPRILKLL